MYYIVYGLLYAISLLPLRILFLLSDLAYVVMYYFVRYRRDLIRSNLAIAFPEKTEAQRVRIHKQFMRNFTDVFIETIKMISIRPKELNRRAISDMTYIKQLEAQGYNLHLLAGHQFNWEFGNLLYGSAITIPFIGVYTKVSNKILDKIFYKARSRYGTLMVSKEDFRRRRVELLADRYMLALAADQNPADPATGYWMNFFGNPAPFIPGPTKAAVKSDSAVIYFAFRKLKRGVYQFTAHPITLHAADHRPEDLTMIYKNLLEDAIRLDPANYLWSHRRWRHEYKPDYPHIIDEALVLKKK